MRCEDAQFCLGVVFQNGLGVVQDYAEAARLDRLALDQGHVGAQFSLGLMFFAGLGPCSEASGEIDYDEKLLESVRLFCLAAAQGHAAAQYRLGIAFEWGEGVAQDQSEAVRWYRLAALHGSASAQESMGTIMEKQVCPISPCSYHVLLCARVVCHPCSSRHCVTACRTETRGC